VTLEKRGCLGRFFLQVFRNRGFQTDPCALARLCHCRHINYSLLSTSPRTVRQIPVVVGKWRNRTPPCGVIISGYARLGAWTVFSAPTLLFGGAPLVAMASDPQGGPNVAAGAIYHSSVGRVGLACG
jgi:hypothetical protein